MKTYPSIGGPASGHKKPMTAFFKYDGSNIRVEFDRKKGFCKFGTKKNMFDETSEWFGPAIPLFHEMWGEKLESLIRKDKHLKTFQKITFFFEYFGEKSFAGWHDMADPKTLWKNLPSNKEDIYWKEDNVTLCEKLGEKTIVVSSKRGRSHQNVGSFRDDDFSFKHYQSSGWSLVCVADGAGSYSLSRKGSQIACNAVVEFFDTNLNTEKQAEFELKTIEFGKSKDETLKKEIEGLAAQSLYKAVLFAHNKIKEHADATFLSNPELFNNPKAKSPLDYYHSTLLFTLFKKYEFGYVILTFAVGDCPGAFMNKEKTESTMLNWLDVGEFGGGTRFITQPEIFHSTEQPMVSRFSLKIAEDFSYLFLMSDGIYDPKFEVEANLEKNEKWIEFLADLEGSNEDNVKIDFNFDNKEITNQLSSWMDFWSKGNHDDRTLAIVF